MEKGKRNIKRRRGKKQEKRNQIQWNALNQIFKTLRCQEMMIV